MGTLVCHVLAGRHQSTATEADETPLPQHLASAGDVYPTLSSEVEHLAGRSPIRMVVLDGLHSDICRQESYPLD